MARWMTVPATSISCEALAGAMIAFNKGEVGGGDVEKMAASSVEVTTCRNLPTPLLTPRSLPSAKPQRLSAWRLTGCTLYVTLEPCLMCAGAIILGRIDRLVYGADDPKAGAVRSLYRSLEDTRLNHQVVIQEGVLAAECADLMRRFFRRLR